MSKAEFVFKVLPILLIGGIGTQTAVSCAFSVEDYDKKSSSSLGTSSPSSSGKSSSSSSGTSSPSSSGTGSSSSSDTGSPSSSGAGSSSSSGTGSPSSSSASSPSSSGTGPSSSAIYSGDEFCDANPPEPPKPPVFGADLVDSRNSKTYKTVIIGRQTWMAVNLDYVPASGTTKCYGLGDEIDPNKTQGWLSQQQAQLNCDKYGRLYNHATAKTACPAGWHLPSRDEWNELKGFVEGELYQNCEDYWYDWDVGTKLKSKSEWKEHSEMGKGRGEDSYGFNAIGGGFCVNCNTNALGDGSGYYSGVEMNYKKGNQSPSLFNPALNQSLNASWWSSTDFNTTDAWKFEMTFDKNVMNEKRESKTDFLLSVRCLKD